ncbi:hypothetical protein EV126DRAFT_62919 [Verticillium dahliae]|nr:hypothetical protein EV126DRAFT_62919 [Verticillium dahliae]
MQTSPRFIHCMRFLSVVAHVSPCVLLLLLLTLARCSAGHCWATHVTTPARSLSGLLSKRKSWSAPCNPAAHRPSRRAPNVSNRAARDTTAEKAMSQALCVLQCVCVCVCVCLAASSRIPQPQRAVRLVPVWRTEWQPDGHQSGQRRRGRGGGDDLLTREKETKAPRVHPGKGSPAKAKARPPPTTRVRPSSLVDD